MEHLSDRQVAGYAGRSLSPDELLLVDDHVADCQDCRARTAAAAGSPSAALLPALLPVESHLTDDQLDRQLSGQDDAKTRAEIEQHLRACATCARESEAMRAWARRRSRARWVPYGAAAAAAVLLAVLATSGRWPSAREAEPSPPAMAGLEALAPIHQERVRRALADGVAEPPMFLAGLRGRTEELMGTADEGFALVEPVATATVSDRPTFRWRPLPGAEAYVVTIADGDALVSSEHLSETSWTPDHALARGRVYTWQVTARRRGSDVIAPAPPAPLARFRVVDAETAVLLARVAARNAQSHLLLGILYAQAGVRDEADRHLLQVPPTDPGYEVARRTRDRLR